MHSAVIRSNTVIILGTPFSWCYDVGFSNFGPNCKHHHLVSVSDRSTVNRRFLLVEEFVFFLLSSSFFFFDGPLSVFFSSSVERVFCSEALAS